MRILQTCTRFPPAPGGVETHVYHIANELMARGHDVRVHTTDLYMEIPFTRLKDRAGSVDGVPVHRHKGYSLHGDMHYIFVPGFLPSILRSDVDIIHAHSYGYFQVNVAALNRRLRSTPFVLTPHYHPQWSMWGGKKRKKLRGFYDKVFAANVVKSGDRIIGMSRHEIGLLSQVIDIDMSRVRYIPAGIDFTRFDPIPDPGRFRDRYGLNGPFVLYAGRLASNKGLHVLVEAASVVLKNHPGIKFVLIGEDEGMRSKLEWRIKELGIGKQFIFTGHIKDETLFLSAYAGSEMFVLPSEYEAFGIVLLEAMACAKPIVATRAGGIPEVIGNDPETGLLVDYGDSDALAEAVIELLSDSKKRSRLGKAGRTRVKAHFTWPTIVTQLENVYKELVK